MASIGDLNLPFLSSLNKGNSLKGGDIVELCGDPGCGKSELLLNMAAETILPYDYNGHYVGGCGMGVIFISTDRKFDLLRLVSLVEHRLAERMFLKNNENTFVSLQEVDIAVSPSSSTITHKQSTVDKGLITSCLERLYIFNCNSQTQLIMTSLFLKSFLLNSPQIKLILIDSALSTNTDLNTTDLNTDSNDTWLDILKNTISDQITLIITSQPHTKLKQESLHHSLYHNTFNISKQSNHSHSVTSTQSGQSWTFTINNSGVQF